MNFDRPPAPLEDGRDEKDYQADRDWERVRMREERHTPAETVSVETGQGDFYNVHLRNLNTFWEAHVTKRDPETWQWITHERCYGKTRVEAVAEAAKVLAR